MLDKKVAIITGGTRGIGLAKAKKFIEENAIVVIFGSKKETVDKALSQLKEAFPKKEILGFYPSLIDESELKEVFNKIKEKFGHIDIIVNNAGISSKTKIDDYSEEEYDKISNLNIKSLFMVSKVAVPYLKQSKGVILNTSSMVSIYGQPSGVMYPTSKYAVNGITKSLARELAPFGIRVNAVAPGIIETDMVKNLPKEMIEPLIKSIPIGRIGKPEDVANAFLFLASDMASYITGVILSVDGLSRS